MLTEIHGDFTNIFAIPQSVISKLQRMYLPIRNVSLFFLSDIFLQNVRYSEAEDLKIHTSTRCLSRKTQLNHVLLYRSVLRLNFEISPVESGKRKQKMSCNLTEVCYVVCNWNIF